MLIPAPEYTVLGFHQLVNADGAGDILEVRTPADAVLVPLEAWVQADDDEQSAQVTISLNTFATAGSGGVSRTPQKHNEHLQASQTTCLSNNTTDATGTNRIYDRHAANLIGDGWRWDGEGKGIIVTISTSLVLKLLAAVPQDVNVSYGIRFAELGQ